MFKGQVTDVFFDLDHTLWDFEKNSALTFQKILREQQITLNLTSFLEIYVPINLAYWKLYREEKVSKEELRYARLKETFDKLAYSIEDEVIHVLSDEYIENLSSFNHLFPHTMEILEYLKLQYRLHIITNGFREIQEKKLKGANIFDFFDCVVNSEMAGVKKPNPHIFKLALNKADVGPENSIMIGDNLEADILGAKAVGMHLLHFNVHNEPKHEYCPIITDLREIKSFL